MWSSDDRYCHPVQLVAPTFAEYTRILREVRVKDTFGQWHMFAVGKGVSIPPGAVESLYYLPCTNHIVCFAMFFPFILTPRFINNVSLAYSLPFLTGNGLGCFVCQDSEAPFCAHSKRSNRH